MLNSGIIGLPNAGKSTLFNALTRSHHADAADYPFCTIEPNRGIVQAPDDRLVPLAELVRVKTIIPAAVELVDIAGLVAGASKGEGLGNRFLGHIREVDAIIHLVRCFEDEKVVHPAGTLDPVRDIGIVVNELILADLESAESQLDKNRKKAKGNDKDAAANAALLERIIVHLKGGQPVNTLPMEDDNVQRLNGFFLLTSKPALYVCNVAETSLADPGTDPQVKEVRQYVDQHQQAAFCIFCAKLEEDLGDLDKEEVGEYLTAFGVKDSGVALLIESIRHLLGLASFYTFNETELRAWTFKKGMTARECAGLIHTDFAEGFIKAEVVSCGDLIASGSVAAAREAGKYRIEGKDHPLKDGDVVLFRFKT